MGTFKNQSLYFLITELCTFVVPVHYHLFVCHPPFDSVNFHNVVAMIVDMYIRLSHYDSPRLVVLCYLSVIDLFPKMCY